MVTTYIQNLDFHLIRLVFHQFLMTRLRRRQILFDGIPLDKMSVRAALHVASPIPQSLRRTPPGHTHIMILVVGQ
jgi:hypothetical protein